MKILYLTLFTCFLVTGSQAQVAKTLEVSSGRLDTLLTPLELLHVTDLTLTGTIDARDFKTMRDKMPVLTHVNLSEVTIVTYLGTEGTNQNYPNNQYNTNYPDNELPAYSFYNKSTIVSVTLPLSVTSIGKNSFNGCTGLISYKIPSSVLTIDTRAFLGCVNLQSVDLPGQLTRIGNNAFGNCSALISIDIPSSVRELGIDAFKECSGLTSIKLSSSLTSIKKNTFFNCSGFSSIDIPSSVISIEESAFFGCRKLKSISIPTSVTSIGDGSFGYCTDLTSITIPLSVKSIGNWAFYGNLALKTFYANSSVPVDLSHSNIVFPYFDSFYCKLIVPYQSRARYVISKTWKDFPKIEEAPSGIALSVNYLEYDAATHSHTFDITSNVDWSISSDKPWLTVNTSSGTGNLMVTLTIEANPTFYRRRGQITVTPSDEGIAQVITIVQEGAAKTINLTAGGLLSALTEEEMKGITSLTLEGSIDARDFKTMRNKMPMLTTLDLSRTTVVAYAGTEGTIPVMDDPSPSYKANTIPKYAFNNPYDFYPYADNYINKDKLKSIILPSSITAIGKYAFIDCEGLNSIEIPEGVEKVDDYAFQYCDQLIKITLPSSLLHLGNGVFQDCISLKEIISKSVTPVSIQQNYEAFINVKTFYCLLYVPAGSKDLYAVAYQWKNFDIVEMTTGTKDMELNKTMFTCYPNPFTRHMSIEIENPSHKSISVDIYGINGQRIKSLSQAGKEAKISLVWDGKNEQGQVVPFGIYILKVNEAVRKVVFGK